MGRIEGTAHCGGPQGGGGCRCGRAGIGEGVTLRPGRAGEIMKTRLINDGPQKTYVMVLDKGDEAVSSIEGFARKNGIAAAQLTGIGAFSDAVLGFFDWETKNYREIPITEQVEVGSLLGDVALGADGQPALHRHVVVSRADGIAMGGH